MERVTVIVPTFERPAQLARCLEGIRGAGEIIVTDDSRDATTKALVERDFPAARWIEGPRRGPAANRNHGARAAAGTWLVFIDDDCEPQPGWLHGFSFDADEADVIEGCTLAPEASDSPFEEHVENPRGGLLWSCNLAVRREVFTQLGGFDEDFGEAGGEDMEFAWRVAHAGLRVQFAAAALALHPPRRIGWRGLWRRTWMIRWMALYRLKTGQQTGFAASMARECFDLLRVSAQLFRRPEPARWRRRTFAVAWRWLTFPAVLPWLLFWEARFRRKP